MCWSPLSSWPAADTVPSTRSNMRALAFRSWPAAPAPQPAHAGNGTGARGFRQNPLTWYRQLPALSTTHSRWAATYDIDGFTNSAGEVATLHGQGKHVICYIDVGTAENFRPDYSSFPASVLGGSNGWPGERWLDISKLAILESIMTARFQMCRERASTPSSPTTWTAMKTAPDSRSQPPRRSPSFNDWGSRRGCTPWATAASRRTTANRRASSSPTSTARSSIRSSATRIHENANFQPYLAAGKPTRRRVRPLDELLVGGRQRGRDHGS